MLLEVGHNLSLVLHELLLLISGLLLDLDDLLLELVDPFLKLHLDELFVAARVVFELVQHALVFLLQLLELTPMLLGQVRLKRLVLLLRLLLVSLELLCDVLELASECLSSFVSALHRVTQLGLQVGDLGLEFSNFLFQLGDTALFHLDLLAKTRHLDLVVADLVVPFANSALKSSNLRQ